MEGKIGSLNLVNQVKAEIITRPPGFYKSIVFDVLAVLSASSAGYFYFNYLGSKTSLTLVLIALGIFFIFSALQVFLTKSLGRRFLIALLEAAAFLVYFYNYDLKILGVSAIIILVFYFWGVASAQKELQNGLKIRFFRTVRQVLGKLTTAFALALVILYLGRWDQKNIFISEKTFQTFFGWTVNLIGNFYPEVNISSSFEKFGESLAKLQLQNNSAFANLPLSDQQAALNQTVNQVTVSLKQRLGINILPGESTERVIYNFLLKTLNDWRDRFPGVFIVGWVVAMFLVVRGFGSIFLLLVSFISFVIYQLLVASDFIHIRGEPATREVIEF